MRRPWSKHSQNNHNKWNRETYVDDRVVKDYINPSYQKNRKSTVHFSKHALREAAENEMHSTGSYSGSGLARGEAWVRLVIVYGCEYSEQWIRETIVNSLPTRTKIFNYHLDGKNVMLYLKIRSKQMGVFKESLSKIRNPKNDPLSYDTSFVTEPGIPVIKNINREGYNLFPNEWILALEKAFLERFQRATKSLDLSSLHTDPDLLSVGLYLPLNKPGVAANIVNILLKNNAEFELLNLSSNRLHSLSHLGGLVNEHITIRKLDLSSNGLTNLTVLSSLSNLNGLQSLDLSDNPVVNRMSDFHRKLSSKLTQFFPGLKELNGKSLPEAVMIASSSSAKQSAPVKPLPNYILGYFPNDDIKIAVLTFLKQFYEKFDSVDRGESIMPYYSTDSLMTFCVTSYIPHVDPDYNCEMISDVQNGIVTNKTLLTTMKMADCYYPESRNLIKVKSQVKQRMIHKGTLSICGVYKKFPVTEHILESFAVDVTTYNEQLVIFNVSGVFYEIYDMEKQRKKVPRNFTRTFTVAPGELIIHDMFSIVSATNDICKRYIYDAKYKQNTDVQCTTSHSTDKQVLLQEFMKKTSMNKSYAEQCLQEFMWDFNVAFSNFEVMAKAGQIPAAAFS